MGGRNESEGGVALARSLRTNWRLWVTAIGIVAIVVGSAGLLFTDASLLELDSGYSYGLLFGLGCYVLLTATSPATDDSYTDGEDPAVDGGDERTGTDR